LVEDDDEIAHSVSVIASGEDWDLFQARSGEEAIALWAGGRRAGSHAPRALTWPTIGAQARGDSGQSITPNQKNTLSS
jgi:hypothetical protein